MTRPLPEPVFGTSTGDVESAGADEADALWRMHGPLVDYRPEPHHFEAGTRGPAPMDQGLALGGEAWTGDS